jgi:hypothetical protein
VFLLSALVANDAMVARAGDAEVLALAAIRDFGNLLRFADQAAYLSAARLAATVVAMIAAIAGLGGASARDQQHGAANDSYHGGISFRLKAVGKRVAGASV